MASKRGRRGGIKKQKFELTVKGHPMNCTLYSGLNGKPALLCNTPSDASPRSSPKKASPAKRKAPSKKKSNPSRRAKKR